MDTNKIVARFLDAQNSLVVQSSDFSLETLSAMVSSGTIDISPHYQRRVRWNAREQSLLIESFLLNIPVPPIYLSEDEYGRYSVIDGKQRLTAIHSFISNELCLSGLGTFDSLNGMKMKNLPGELKNALCVRPYIRAITLLRQSYPSLKYEVFTRLNKQGAPLTSQEIRNVLFRGPLNDLLHDLSENMFLRQQLKITTPSSSAYRKMKDLECVLRFFALLETWEKFSGSYDRTMDNFMMEHRNVDEKELMNLAYTFDRCMHWCEELWGEHAFQRGDKGGWRNQMLTGMYDAQMVAVSLTEDSILETVNARKIQELTISLFIQDDKFDESVRVGTNTPDRIIYRIKSIRNLFESASVA